MAPDATPTTVTITGAGGQIGYALLFRIAAGDMLGPDRPVRLRLLEIPQGMRAAEGAALELMDGAFPLLTDVEVTDDAHAGFDGCNISDTSVPTGFGDASASASPADSSSTI